MKRRMKTRISIALLLALLCTQLSAFAAAPENSEITPFYTGMSSLVVDITVTSYGRADCSAEAQIRDGYKCDLELYLMQSSDGNNWTTIKDWSTSGTGTVTLEKMWYIDSGYYYKTCAYVAVYTTGGAFVEGKELYSGVDSYGI